MGGREEGREGRRGRTNPKVHDVLAGRNDDPDQDQEGRHPTVGHQPLPEEEEGGTVVGWW